MSWITFVCLADGFSKEIVKRLRKLRTDSRRYFNTMSGPKVGFPIRRESADHFAATVKCLPSLADAFSTFSLVGAMAPETVEYYFALWRVQ